MRALIPIFLLMLFPVVPVMGQQPRFSIEIEEVGFPGFPGLQSFAHAQYEGKWIIVGGRTDGLHRRQPFAAFLAADNNQMIYVADIQSGEVWSRPLSDLPVPLREQLQSTNMEFVQRDSTLYLIGGYGFSATANDHITYPQLVAVDLPGLIGDVIQNVSMQSRFRSLTDNRLRVTGGYLGYLDQRFYLVGGQNFQGRYNPMDPGHGPGFIQQYTNAIKSFEIADDGTSLSIQAYQETADSLVLHRRDYNMTPQIFADSTKGFTAFSGVFQYQTDLPWLDVVDISPAGYAVDDSFRQYLNQYHSAHAELYSAGANEMYNLFFGGMSQYYPDSSGLLIEDTNVPFVRTLSLVTRFADGSRHEQAIGTMPALLGASAAFFPAENLITDESGIYMLDEIPAGKTLLGYVAGGIESTQPNIFFINTGVQSDASSRIFKVSINRTTTNLDMPRQSNLSWEAGPNPARNVVQVNLYSENPSDGCLRLADLSGKILWQERVTFADEKKVSVPVKDFSEGMYLLMWCTPGRTLSRKIMLR